jgi:uncharacterized protein (TIGR02284 family)
MEAVTTKLHEAVNELIETCHDGEYGFETAANAVTDESIRAELMQYGRQRAQFIMELDEIMDAVGGSPGNHGSISGAMHRGWMNVRETITGGSEYSVLADCERGEDVAIEAYTSVLHLPLPSLIGEVIASQYHAIKLVHQRVKVLRDNAKRN